MNDVSFVAVLFGKWNLQMIVKGSISSLEEEFFGGGGSTPNAAQ